MEFYIFLLESKYSIQAALTDMKIWKILNSSVISDPVRLKFMH